MDWTTQRTPEHPVNSSARPAGLRLVGITILAGIAGGLVAAIVADALGLSALLAGAVAGIAMALFVALIILHERRRAA